MVMPGQLSVCFSCGQPLPREIGTSALPAPPGVSAASGRPAFPLTSALQASPLVAPPNPYANAIPTSATIVGAAGQFAIKSGSEVRVGRDPATCPITLTDPKVSGNHATLKFENGGLLVRDDGSNNGTYIDGARIPAQTWTPVSPNVRIRFGPVEFVVKID